MNYILPLDERPPSLAPDETEKPAPGEAQATTGSEALPPPARGGHSAEYELAMAARLQSLACALEAHQALQQLDPEDCRSRIALRYASANYLRALEVERTHAVVLDQKIEKALRP
jgi:hypothetical protein